MLEGTIKVYECSELQDSKFSKEGYYKISGKMAGVVTDWISDVKLASQQDYDVKLSLSMYQGKFNLRIAEVIS